MIAEITVTPIGRAHLAETIAQVVELVERSGLQHEVTAMGTLVSGEADDVWGVLRQCHELALRDSGRVLTDIRIEGGRDDEDLRHGPRRVQEILDHEQKT